MMNYSPSRRVFVIAILSLAACALPLAWAHEAPQRAAAPPPPSWEKLKAAYAYTVPAAFKVAEEAREGGEYRVWHLSFTDTKGERVPGVFMRPKGEGRYPCVLLLHGLTGSKEAIMQRFGQELAARGMASLALDADRHGERRRPDAPPGGGAVFVGIVRGGIVDYRLALDYLKTRADVESGRIGLMGYSMGAMMGAILSGVDARIQATVLCVGGDMTRDRVGSLPEEARMPLESASPSNYVGHISPRPLLMINGKQDTTVPEAAARRLHDAAKEPKQVIWADAGHGLPGSSTLKGIEWLAEKLGKGR